MKIETEVEPRKKRRRRSARRHNVPVPDKYFCTHCKKEHFKGLLRKSSYVKHYILYREKKAAASPEDELPVKLEPVSFEGKTVTLDEKRRGPAVVEFKKFIESRIVGQPQAVESFTDLAAKVEADVCDRWKPRGIYLLLGPTGVGKTRIVEALAEYYFHSRKKMLKINCGEIATMFSFKKFGDTLFDAPNLLMQTKNGGKNFGIILFDEIEKATVLLYKLLLGVLDRGYLTVDDKEIDLRHTVVIMTSNLGAADIQKILTKAGNKIDAEVRAQMEATAVAAATERFTPEFFNRLDEVVVFNPLLPEHLQKIVGLEIDSLEQRLVSRGIRIQCSEKSIAHMVKVGTDTRYGARHLRRALEKIVVKPLAHMITAGELKDKSRVKILYQDGGLKFKKVV